MKCNNVGVALSQPHFANAVDVSSNNSWGPEIGCAVETGWQPGTKPPFASADNNTHEDQFQQSHSKHKSSSLSHSQVCGSPTFKREIISVSPVGVDTIRLQWKIQPSQVKANNRFKIEHNTSVELNRLLFTTESGKRITGSRAVYRDKLAFLTIHPAKVIMRRKAGRCLPATGMSICRVCFSVAKINGNGENTNPTSIEELRSVVDKVALILKKVGLAVDINDAEIIRLDLFRNIALRPSTKEFLQFQEFLIPCRKSKHIYSSGYGSQHRNRGECFSFYCKSLERHKAGYDVTRLPDNLLRVEWQLRQKRLMRKIPNVETLRDLLNGWKPVEATFGKALNEQLFDQLIDQKNVSRRFQNGVVGHRLKTIAHYLLRNGVNGYDIETLRAKLRTGGPESLHHEILKTGMPRKWINVRVRAIRVALWIEAIEAHPEFLLRLMALRWAVNLDGPYRWRKVGALKIRSRKGLFAYPD